MLKIAVCDDEPFMLEDISGRVSKYMEETRAGPYSVDGFPNSRLLLESDQDFDLIFLDIQMERPDGMETAKILRERRSQSLLIFVTVLKECVFDAFEVEAYGYLLKPLDGGSFERTMDRAVRTLEQRRTRGVVVQRGTSSEVVLLARIVYCEVQGRKVYIHQADGEVIDCYERLDSFERRVDGRFFRCHRSYLVNLAYVRGCRGGQIMLFQGGQIPVSRLREPELKRALLRYMREKNF